MGNKIGDQKWAGLESITDTSLLLFIMAKVGVINNVICEYIFLAIFIFCILRKIIQTGKVKVTLQVALYALFAVYSGVSLLWAMSSEFVFQALPSVVALAVFLLALTNYISSKKDIIRVAKFIVFACVLVSFKILIGFWFANGIPAERILAITGVYYNTVGQIIAITLIFAYMLFRVTGERGYLYCMVPMLVVVLLSQSRKSLLVPLVAGGLLVLMTGYKKKRLLKYMGVMSLVAIVTVGLIYMFSQLGISFFADIVDKMNNLVSYIFGRESGEWSIQLRSMFIDTGMGIFSEHPMFGIGLNNFSYYMREFTSYGVARYAHNNFIEILSCLGVVGFVIYYAVFVYMFVKLWKQYKSNKKIDYFNAGSLAVLITMIAMDWGVVSYSGAMYFVFYVLIFSYARKNIVESDRRNEKA